MWRPGNIPNQYVWLKFSTTYVTKAHGVLAAITTLETVCMTRTGYINSMGEGYKGNNISKKVLENVLTIGVETLADFRR